MRRCYVDFLKAKKTYECHFCNVIDGTSYFEVRKWKSYKIDLRFQKEMLFLKDGL